MKKFIITIILIIVLLVPAISSQMNSHDTDFSRIPAKEHIRHTDQEHVLIFMDDLPWGVECIQDILDSLGTVYSEATSSEMATINMSQFDVIIIASAQPTNFYMEYQRRISLFEEYLDNGGVLQFHCATLEMSFWEPMTLPGGITHEQYDFHFNYKLNVNHPIVVNLPDTLHGSFASHEHFLNIPIAVDTITVDELYLPTTIEYPYGDGTIIATGMAWEFNYNFGYTSGGCLPNAIAYSLSLAGGDPFNITMIPTNPPIIIPAAGGSFDYNIAVENNSGLQAVFDVWCNVTLPDCTSFGPVLGPVNLNVPNLFNVNRDRSQAVPGSAPQGVYTFKGYLGVYPDTVWQEDHFDFEKSATDCETGFVHDWTNTGEPFAGDTKTEILHSPSITHNFIHPNPFNQQTAISFQLFAESFVKLTIYDIQGREVARLVDGYKSTGTHEVIFDAKDLVSGVYFVRCAGNGITDIRKILLLK